MRLHPIVQVVAVVLLQIALAVVIAYLAGSESPNDTEPTNSSVPANIDQPLRADYLVDRAS